MSNRVLCRNLSIPSKKSVAFKHVKQCVLTIKTFTNKLLLGIYTYDPETTDQSSEYHLKGEAKPERPRQSRSKIKVMLTVFFDYRGVVHYEFLPSGQTVN